MRKISKVISVLKRGLIKKMVYYNVDSYLSSYTKYLQEIGVQFTGEKRKIKYIDPSVYFDGTDYSLISLGDNVTISREVMILTHDYSITTAMCTLGKRIERHEGELFFLKGISVGDDTFIGARVSLLPGTKIGKNCIIGACAVVKGDIPDDSIVVGNPGKIIGRTSDYASKHAVLEDYCIEL